MEHKHFKKGERHERESGTTRIKKAFIAASYSHDCDGRGHWYRNL